MRWFRRRRRKFSSSSPRPIDRAIAEMKRRSGTTATRDDALSVPAVQRGRNLVCSIATLPLEQLDPTNRVQRSRLLEQVDPDVPNVVTLAQTLEDLLFEGISWWEITGQDFDGFPVAARHLDVTAVSINPPPGATPDPLPHGRDPRDAVVWVDGQPVSASRVIRFDSPNPGVLQVSGRPIDRAIALDKAAGTYADDPRPLDYFSPADGADEVDDDEVDGILARWKAARKNRGTAWVPASLSYNSVDAPSPQELQLVELQRQAGLDLANAMGVDPEDLGISTTSRTYANDVDRRRNKLNEVLAPYIRAIEHRLSMEDVTRRGWRVRFDPAEFLMPNPSDRWSNYETALRMGAITLAEIREAEGMPPLPADAQPAPAPEPEPDGADAHGPAGWTFNDSQLTFVDLPVQEFSVDRENRIIEGLTLPYGKVANQGGLKFRFRKGALQYSDVSRVKLVFPGHGEAVGKAIQLRDTRDGMLARFKVGRGAEGDRALELAEDGVYDGFSVGVDFDVQADATPSSRDRSVLDVSRADLRHVALTSEPAFDDARVTKVAASRNGAIMQCTACGQEHAEGVACPTNDNTPAEPAQTFTADQVQAMLAAVAGGNGAQPAQPAPAAPAGTEGAENGSENDPEGGGERQIVDPTRRPARLSVTREQLPYRFDRGGNFTQGEHEFSTDLRDMLRAGDTYGESEAGKRAMGLVQRTFDVQGTDVNELNPNIDRPDMYVPEQSFRYPIWNAINKGSPPNGVQPFTFPKFNSSSGLVSDHTEGTEPGTGSFTTTNQTVTPSPVSGKASITREVWEMGGNPAVSTLIFNQMVRGYREGLENGASTFLATLTAATDVNLGADVHDADLIDAWDAAVANLQFIRGYDLSVFVVEQILYGEFVAAADTTGRKLVPQIAPQNANATAARRFMTLDLAGVVGVPSWALASSASAQNASWLFDPEFVHGWATTPQRLEFAGTDSSGDYAPVAYVDIGIWGYEAFANSDIGAVREVLYDEDAA